TIHSRLFGPFDLESRQPVQRPHAQPHVHTGGVDIKRRGRTSKDGDSKESPAVAAESQTSADMGRQQQRRDVPIMRRASAGGKESGLVRGGSSSGDQSVSKGRLLLASLLLTGNRRRDSARSGPFTRRFLLQSNPATHRIAAMHLVRAPS